MDCTALITQSKLKEYVYYDPDTGEFTRLKDGAVNTRAGDKINSLSTHGYINSMINGKRYLMHRLAWLYVYGGFPIGDIDHINGDRKDNRISNLRVASALENSRNKKIPSNNTSGLMGVRWDKARSKWRVLIGVKGFEVHLGRFTDKWDAMCARKSAERKYGFHENHGRNI